MLKNLELKFKIRIGKVYSEKIIPKIKNAEHKAIRKLSEEHSSALLGATKLFAEYFHEYFYAEE